MSEQACIFCQIAAGQAPCHKIWEDEKHLAFLSIFPNTEGMTVVIPKIHYDSYVFAVPQKVREELLVAAQKVAQILDQNLADVGRCGLVFEGFGVNHLHAKLFPLHGTKSGEWEEHKSKIDTYFEFYPGYISSNDSLRAADTELAKLAEKLKA